MKYKRLIKGERMGRRTVNIINIKKKRKSLYVKVGMNYSDKNLKNKKIYLDGACFLQSLAKYIGQTITIYTVSGGQSGSGFTGVLLEVCRDCIKILTSAASVPDLTLVSDCIENKADSHSFGNSSMPVNLGSIAEIPLNKIAAFIHNII